MNAARRLSELERKLSNTLLVGKVAEIDEAKGCRIEAGELLTDWLPVLHGRQGALKQRAPMNVGEVVLVVCAEGDPAQGFIIGSIDADSIGEFNMVFEDGTSISYDRETKELRAVSTGTLKASAAVAAEISAPAVNLISTTAVNITAPAIVLAGAVTVNGTPLVSPGTSF